MSENNMMPELTLNAEAAQAEVPQLVLGKIGNSDIGDIAIDLNPFMFFAVEQTGDNFHFSFSFADFYDVFLCYFL